MSSAVRTRTELLLETIRQDIVRNVLPPGARLTEEALAERYGTSRTPVREALRLLTNESLVHYFPRSGHVVAAVDLEEMDDLYGVRAAIEEQAAVRTARGLAGPDLPDLLSFWADPPLPGTNGDVNLVFADEHFHETLAAASGSTVLLPMLRNINTRLHALRIRDFLDPVRVQRTYEQHASVVRCLLEGDARLATAILRAHIWESHAFVRESAVRSLTLTVAQVSQRAAVGQ